MNSFLQIDKGEWEAFLEKLSEFEKKYSLLLSKMDAIQGKLQAEEERDEEDEKPEKTAYTETSTSLPERQLERTLGGGKDRSLPRFREQSPARRTNPARKFRKPRTLLRT